jgi:hypothetical protein
LIEIRTIADIVIIIAIAIDSFAAAFVSESFERKTAIAGIKGFQIWRYLLARGFQNSLV